MTIHNKQTPWLGCIADDYTGATDLASFLVASGLKTLQINGLPSDEQCANLTEVDALVIALKSRTLPVDEAVDVSLAALAKLQELGCQKFYFKYCSTFDSTTKGNIGPVADALMAALGEHSTLVCPALPVNGRTVYQGSLFVFDQPLHESPMKDHPLTPMTDSSVVRMIEAQGAGKAKLVPFGIIDQGEQAIAEAFANSRENAQYVVADALTQAHLASMSAGIAQFKLITGGSGLAVALGTVFEQQGGQLKSALDSVRPIKAPSLVLSGSCSSMTLKQVAAYKERHPTLLLDVDKLARGEQNLASLLVWLDTVKDQAPLIAATAPPEEIVQNQEKYGASYVAELIEQTFANLSRRAQSELGFRNFVVAGGETSGAVVNGLGVDSFFIGKTIAPGVPMVQTLSKVPINLALKSGNFGETDFFYKAVETLTCY